MDRYARRVIKTYARQKKPLYGDDSERAPKRRRLDANGTINDPNPRQNTYHKDVLGQSDIIPTSSSPPVTTASSSSPRHQASLFSDPAMVSSSPPSSPPQLSFAPDVTRKYTFSSLKHEPVVTLETSGGALSESTGNAQKRPLPKKRRLVQLQLDLGGETRKTCKTCGMEYIPSNAEDVALHRQFHAMNVAAVEVSRSFLDYVGVNAVWRDGTDTFIAVVDGRDSMMARNQAKRVLQVVNSELSAVQLTDAELWSQLDLESEAKSVSPLSGAAEVSVRAKEMPQRCGRFQVYLYVQGCKCIGLCLAERISTARKVIKSSHDLHGPLGCSAAHQGSSVSASQDSFPAVVGIQRIWTSTSHRKKGIATTLLDTALDSFLYGLRVPKHMVAFSQPTESGGKLARRWFAKEDGWLVYSES